MVVNEALYCNNPGNRQGKKNTGHIPVTKDIASALLVVVPFPEVHYQHVPTDCTLY